MTVFLYDDLKPGRVVHADQVDCPVMGCRRRVKRAVRGWRPGTEYRCPDHGIDASTTLFDDCRLDLAALPEVTYATLTWLRLSLANRGQLHLAGGPSGAKRHGDPESIPRKGAAAPSRMRSSPCPFQSLSGTSA